MKSPLRKQALYINPGSIISPKSTNNKEDSVHRWWDHRSLKFRSPLKKGNSIHKFWENSVIVYHHNNKEIIFKMEKATPFAPPWKLVDYAATCIYMHLYSKICCACCKRLPEREWSPGNIVKLLPCVKMHPCPHDWHLACDVHTFLLFPFFSHCHSLLLSLCSVLTTFCKWSWLHHVAAFIWSEIPQAAPAQGTRQHFASWCNYGSRHYSKKQQLNGVWREMWPSHSICLIAAMPSLASTSKVWCMEGTLLQMETCKVASCKAAQREGHSPRKPWTSHGS